MGRARRNFTKQGLYHIIQRGNNKTFIFDDQLDKAMFVDMIQNVMREHPFNLIYYIFMDNHYHLLMEMLDTEISAIMRLLNMRYSKYYNKKYSRTGTIFDGRYHAFPVLDEKYLVRVIGYIANNPVKAKIVKKASEYKWSAHYEVVSDHKRLINLSRLYELLDDSSKRAREIYMTLIDDEHFNQEFINYEPVEMIRKLAKEKRKESIETVLLEFLEGDADKYALLASPDRSPSRTFWRLNCTKHAFENGFTYKEIAAVFKISERAVRYFLP